MQRKSLVITAALVAGLALGIVFGPSVRSSSASAQTQPSATAQPSASTQPSSAAQATAPSNALWNSFLDKLAAALNIQRAALDSAIVTAGTGTADEAAQQGTLTQAQADALKARIQAGDVGALFGGRGGHGGGSRMNGVQQAMLDAAASKLNITADELRTQLRAGQTLTQLAQANSTTEQAVIDAALAAAKTQLDQAVANGTLTQAQADAKYAQLQQQGANLFMQRGRGPGEHDKGAAPTAPATPNSSSTNPDA